MLPVRKELPFNDNEIIRDTRMASNGSTIDLLMPPNQ
jgi:hypothetical protein